MTKPLKIAPWVVTRDLQAIYDYHSQFSAAKADRIVAEYDWIISLIEVNPLIFHIRQSGWRVYPFTSGTYLMYFREFTSFWLVAGLFHARMKPSGIAEQLAVRMKRFP